MDNYPSSAPVLRSLCEVVLIKVHLFYVSLVKSKTFMKYKNACPWTISCIKCLNNKMLHFKLINMLTSNTADSSVRKTQYNDPQNT